MDCQLLCDPPAGQTLNSKTRSGSGVLQRSRRTCFKILPKVLPSPTHRTHQTLRATSGPKTHWKMGTAGPLHGGTRPQSCGNSVRHLFPFGSELVLTLHLPLCLSHPEALRSSLRGEERQRATCPSLCWLAPSSWLQSFPCFQLLVL